MDNRLGKIVELAKHGIGGEKTNALLLVRKLCAQNNLDFDEVMGAGERTHEYTFYYKTKEEETVLAQVLWRFAVTPEHNSLWENKMRKALFAECTMQRYLEAKYAWDIYQKAYRAERKRVLKDLPAAFTIKHRLFKQFEEEGKEHKLPSNDALKEFERQHRMTVDMEDVQLRKAITANGGRIDG